MESAPLALERRGELWLAKDSWTSPSGRRVRVRFAGKGLPNERAEALARLVPEARPAWAEQIHSAEVLDGRVGSCGRGDAVVTGLDDLAVSVVTADCVPVLLAGETRVAAVHAGWRGVVAEVVGAALERLAEPALVAWIGPCIRGAVYEVSPEVADQVVTVSEPAVSVPGPRGRPHVDLAAAVASQLRRGGVEDVRGVDGCTFTDADRLWSYRRDGKEAGRNLSAIWRPSKDG